jgi:hypothetical protein
MSFVITLAQVPSILDKVGPWWVVEQIVDLFHTTHEVKTQQVLCHNRCKPGVSGVETSSLRPTFLTLLDLSHWSLLIIKTVPLSLFHSYRLFLEPLTDSTVSFVYFIFTGSSGNRKNDFLLFQEFNLYKQNTTCFIPPHGFQPPAQI